MPFAPRGLRTGLRLFLAALLLFSQQQAVLHLLGHDLKQLSRSDTGDSQEAACAKCLAIAHLDHAVSGEAGPLVASAAAPDHVVLPASRSFAPAFVARYQSRAPPPFS